MYTSNQFMSLKMLGEPPVKSPWHVEFAGFCMVVGMLVAALIWFSFKKAST